MKKALPLIILLFLFGRSLAQVPAISSFSPASGSVGTVVTISGSNFDPVAANDIVHFGAVTGKVTAATSSSITVQVPAGSTFEPVAITCNSLTAYAQKPFIVTFPDGNAVFSPTSFAPPTDLALNGTQCYDVRKVVMADFDGDGKTDIATNDPNSNTIVVLKNGSGTAGSLFSSTPAATLTTGDTPLQLVAADFDGDGLIDLAVVNRVSNTVSIYKNTSTAAGISFAAKIDLTTVATPGYIAVGDLDVDGKPDIVVTSYVSNTVSVYRNMTDATGIKFAAKTDYAITGPTYVTIGDLNADGKPEVIVSDNSTAVGIMKNESTPGTIVLDKEFDITIGAAGARMVAVCDVDGDGSPDMLVGSIYGLLIYRNTSPASGNFSFAAQVDVPIHIVSADLANREQVRQAEFSNSTSSTTDVSTITAADLDGDGLPDFVVTHISTDVYAEVSVLKNLSTPGNIKLAYDEEFANIDPYTVGIADLDGDGKPDMAVSTEDANIMYWDKNTVTEPTLSGYQTTNGTTVTIAGTNLLKASALTIGGVAVSSFTINSATSITATVAANTTGTIMVVTPYGTGSVLGFTNIPPPVIQSISPAAGPVGTTVVIKGSNFNTSITGNQVFFGAVKASVTAASATSLTVTVPNGSLYQSIKVTNNNLTAFSGTYFNTTFPGGDATFTSSSFSPKTDVKANALPIGITTADFDGDGYLDVVFSTSGNYGYSVYVYQNTKDKSAPFPFTQTVYLTSSGNPVAIASGDFDGDGKPDIIVVNDQTSTFSIFKNTSTAGTMSFAAKQDIPCFDVPTNIFVGDIDGDGKPDIVSVSSQYDSFSIYHNTSQNGVISFAHKIDYTCSSFNVRDITMSDIDGDGKLDVVVSTDQGLDVFRNISVNGSVAFADPVVITTGGSNQGIAIGDLDNDGKQDIAIITAANAVSTYKNTSISGNISFGLIQTNLLPASTFPTYLAINDLNGDGKPDIIISNGNNNASISVLGNTSTTAGLSFAAPVNYTTGAKPEMIAAGDFNNDGKPDIAVAVNQNSGFSLLLSSQALLPTLISYQITTGSTNVKLSGVNLTGATAVTIGGVAVTSFTVVSDTEITALVSISAKGTILVTTPSGIASLNGFAFPSPPTISSSFSSASGSNTQVVITGSYLTGATSVSFDSTPATSFTVNSDTQITGLTRSASFQTITVTTPGGTVKYTVTPGPVITSLDVSSGGPGSTVNITGTGFTGATSVMFGTVAAQSFTVNSATSITAVVGNTGGNAVTVTTASGTNTFTGFQFVPIPVIISFLPAAAKTGDIVTITGSGFINITAVTFGGTPASSFTVNSSTGISAVVGAGSSGELMVTNSSATAAVQGFTFNAGSPLISGISPAVGSEGTEVTITGSNFTGVTAVTFGGTPAQSFTLVSASSITAIVGAGSSGSVGVTTPGGTVSNQTFTFIAKPVISTDGPTTFNTGGSVTLSVAKVTGYTYQWTKDGVAIQDATTTQYKVTESGSYAILVISGAYYITSDPVVVDVIFTLPANNFNTTITGLTCKDAADGMINITAAKALSYTATLTGNSQTKTYTFTTKLAITGLSSGDYSLCFTVDGEAGFNQCSDLVVTQPQDLSVYSSVDQSTNTLNLTLSGGQNYYIQLNGVNYTTQQSTISLHLSSGANKLVVSTDKPCQGTITRFVNISGSSNLPYPNPFGDILNVNLGETNTVSGSIKIYRVSDGVLVFTKQIANQSGVVELDVPQLDKGIYTLVILQDKSTSVFKIVK